MNVSIKTYILATIGMGLLIFLISLAAGDDIAQWAKEQQYEAARRNQTLVEKIIFKPVELVFDSDNQPWGAIVAALAWPLVFIWLFLIVLGLIILSVVDATGMPPRDLDYPTGYLDSFKFIL